jgi:PAS domain S-box-containing protein
MRLAAIVESSPDAIVGCDLEGTIVTWNPAAERLYGYNKREIIGQKATILSSSEVSQEEAMRRIREFHAGCGISEVESVHKSKSGERLPVRVTLAPIILESKVAGASLIVRDMRYQIESQHELEFAKRALHEASEGIIFIDPSGNVVYANNLSQQRLGYEINFKQPIHVSQIAPPLTAQVWQDIVAKLREEHSISIETEHRRSSGENFPVDIVATMLPKGYEERIVCFVRDISERKRTETLTREFVKELEFKTIELERSNQDLDDFAYAAAHDLKSPLRAIDNLARWIIEDSGDILPAQSRKDLDILRGRVTRMESLLSGLLQYSRIGKFKEKMALVDCEQMIKGIVDLIDKPRHMKFHIASNLPTFNTYKMPLEMVFRNLLQNSVTHHDSNDGQVFISCLENPAHYIFEIADDGPGIPNEYKGVVFKMFKTLKPKEQGGGNGVGLALVKKTVENLHGAISLTDNSPKGCRFRIHWPKSY